MGIGKNKDSGVSSEEIRCALGELLLEDDWVRENYLEPYEKLDAEKRDALYDNLREEMHDRFAHMRELVVRMRKRLKDIDGGRE